MEPPLAYYMSRAEPAVEVAGDAWDESAYIAARWDHVWSGPPRRYEGEQHKAFLRRCAQGALGLA